MSLHFDAKSIRHDRGHANGSSRLGVDPKLLDAKPNASLNGISPVDDGHRIRAEQSLRRSEGLYRRLASNFPDGAVLIYDTDLRFLLADGAGLAGVGLSRRAVEGRTLSEVMPARIVRSLEGLFRDALDGRQAAQDLRFGSRTFAITTVPLDAGSPETGIQAMAIVQDVSRQRDLEDRLRGAEARFRSLVEQIPAVIYVQKVGNGENSTVFMSPQVYDIFGYTPEELQDNPESWIETIHPDDRNRVLVGTAISNASGAPFSMEYRALTKSGRTLWVRDEAAVIRDEHGQARFWQGVLSDISDQKQLETALRKSEQRFRGAFDDAPAGMGLFALDGSPEHFNRAFCEMLGYSEQELLSRRIADVTHPEDRERDTLAFRRFRAGETDRYRIIKRFIHRDGDVVWAQFDVSHVLDDDGTPSLIIAHVLNITEQHRLEDELRQSEGVFRSAFDHAAIGMALVSPEGRWLDANASLCRMLGYTRDELLASDFQTITHPDDLETDLELVRSVLAGEISSYDLEKRYIHKAGHLVWGLLSVSLAQAADGSPLHFISQIQDITSRRQLEAQLELQAHHDQLTGLLNRNGLLKLIEHPDPNDSDTVAVLVIDLDGFKAVNDGFGHHAGDSVLLESARRLRACLRDDDHVARFGGDEFLIVLNGPTDRDAVERVAQRIRESVAAPLVLEDGRTSVTLTASIGIEIGRRDRALDELLRAADDAMYRDKRERKAGKAHRRDR